MTLESSIKYIIDEKGIDFLKHKNFFNAVKDLCSFEMPSHRFILETMIKESFIDKLINLSNVNELNQLVHQFQCKTGFGDKEFTYVLYSLNSVNPLVQEKHVNIDNSSENYVRTNICKDKESDAKFSPKKKSLLKGPKGVKTYKVPNEIVRISKEAFAKNTEIECIIMSNNITVIGFECFKNCISLKNVFFSNSIKTIDSSAFYNCQSLIEIRLPNTVVSIGSLCFADCKSLLEINIPNSVNSLASHCFSRCSSLLHIRFPDKIQNIGSGCFAGCESLKELYIPDSVINIGLYAFFNCYSLRKIRLSESLHILEENVFFGCNMLKEIIIPKSVSRIKEHCFCGCASLEKVIFWGIVEIDKGAFSYCPLKLILVPQNTKSHYENLNVFTEKSITIKETIMTI